MLNLDEKISRLADVKSNEEVRSLSYAKFPGTHCPLFGVAMIASFISDLAVLVVGTGECTYYSKGFAYGNQAGKDNFHSLVVGKTDLTFGCGKKLLEALRQIEAGEKPEAVMVVTTCVLEVIGEDLESLLLESQPKFSARLLLVSTEHFKCGSHIPGMERALFSLAGLLEKKEKISKSMNILGHRRHGVEKTEVISALRKEGVSLCGIIPSNCRIADIQEASRASLNVVTDFTALKLAGEMEKKLGIPFVYFGRHLEKERIDREYCKIEELLGVSLLPHLEEKREELSLLEEKAKALFAGKSFIYGNTPMMAFEVSEYLCSLGMVPLFIQIREYYEEERPDMDRILARGYNPYIAQLANIAPMQEVYDLLKPDLYLGHENPMALFQKGIVQITADEAIEKIGYEVPLSFLRKIIGVYESALNSPGVPAGMMSMMGMGMPPAGTALEKPSSRPGAEYWLGKLRELAGGESVPDKKTGFSGLGEMPPVMAEALAKGNMPAVSHAMPKGGKP